ncbi:hypothetical protein [Rhodococcus maanshanensis]|uniref:Energy-coupling factor transport system substrate-specific component n=1 Tax=Rhodococcus maanshanensis TaxID=183556 RepID=A0A1H7TQ24_9NOCA|nr:hypothetical protein [Rhodococcus maanshanensis]SEL86554.1 hypothetical protein SAMN05444583_11645 [Rhodococcus maanshanensis]
MSDASAADSVNPQVDADFRVPWPAVAALAVISVLFGVWSITGAVLTRLPELLVPSAIGLPFGIPALRLFPLGETTITNWLVDCAAALVMLAVVWMRLVNSARRHPGGGVGRAFSAGLGATVIGVLAGNLIRTVYLSFVLQEGPGAYLASLVGGALVSVLWGAIVGLFVGAANALARRISRDAAAPESGNDLPAENESSIAETVTAQP